jgi:hypothetical protein
MSASSFAPLMDVWSANERGASKNWSTTGALHLYPSKRPKHSCHRQARAI